MSKSSVPGLDRIRDLFTSAERAVLESTAGRSLVEASRKQLEASLAQARALRNKWRDLHVAQSRTTKRSRPTAGAGANTRSREKSDMFNAAIERIQARLADFGLAPAAGRPAASRPTKAARQAGHRTSRAAVKGKLAAKAAALNDGRPTKAATRVAAKAVAPAAEPAAARPAAPPRARGTKRRPAKTLVPVKGGGQAVRFDAASQRAAKASATAARLKLDGKLTRRGGHVLASGKRRQAARDRRGR